MNNNNTTSENKETNEGEVNEDNNGRKEDKEGGNKDPNFPGFNGNIMQTEKYCSQHGRKHT
jgi:hypothetical protein